MINILPDSVANQIAAGEVVDRPASAVKELLENALDAGATEIQLIIKDAGRSLIQVIDNGSGMSDSDARLCFERHATSKIKKAEDLFDIHTMGFRGEALASIAAVAQVEMKTRLHDEELGSQVIIEGSDVKEQNPCTCSPGTSIAVKNLFFNIPARRNFLKKDSIELSHIEEVFRRVALPNYNVAFSFHHNGKLLYDLKGGNFAQRIAGIFGNNFSARLYHIEEQTEPVSLFGYVGKEEYVKKVRGEQYLFVNGRFIKHLGLSAAIEKAYNELIPERTYPSYFVLLTVDPSRIDINIHPTKTEVRFIDEHVIFAILRAATKKALGQFSLATELEFNPSPDLNFDPVPKGYTPPAPTVSINPNYNPFYNSGQHGSSTPSQKSIQSQLRNFWNDGSDIGGYSDSDSDSGGDSDSAPAKMPSSGTSSLLGDANRQTAHDDSYATPLNATQNPPFQYAARYVITTLKSGVVVIDQHRAHQRILYERLMARREAAQPSSQQLLFPVNCRFNSSDSELLAEITPDLQKLGFAIATLGQNTFVVTATPPDVHPDDIQPLLEQTLADHKSNMLQRHSDGDRSICLSLARHMAIPAGKVLKPQEMQQLIADLFSCQVPDQSPSGQRIMFIITEQDIAEKMR